MAKRIKLVTPNGLAEIEIFDFDREYFKSLGYTEKSKKTATTKSKEVK